MDRREFDVEVGDGRLHGVRMDGDPPALLLHGGPSLHFSYLDGLLDELDGVVGGIGYQQRGLSPSSVGGPYSVERCVEDAVALLEGFSVSSAWMIGHSWGGYLAMAIAALVPERTVGWVAIDPLGLIGDGGLSDLGTWLTRDLAADERARVRALDAQESSSPDDREVQAEFLAIHWPYYFADPASAPPYSPLTFNPHAFEQIIEDAMAMNVEGQLIDALRTAAIPGFVVAGFASGLRAAAEATAEAVGANLTVIEDCGHFPWIESPGAIRRVVADAVR